MVAQDFWFTSNEYQNSIKFIMILIAMICNWRCAKKKPYCSKMNSIFFIPPNCVRVFRFVCVFFSMFLHLFGGCVSLLYFLFISFCTIKIDCSNANVMIVQWNSLYIRDCGVFIVSICVSFSEICAWLKRHSTHAWHGMACATCLTRYRKYTSHHIRMNNVQTSSGNKWL